MKNSYSALTKVFANIYNLESAKAILSWDSAVMMPEGSSNIRAEQLASLSSVIHSKITDPKINELINTAEAAKSNLNEWEKSNLELIRHKYLHKASVPQDLEEAFSKQSLKCEVKWRTARKESNFSMILPEFKELLNLVREIAKAKSQEFGCSKYQAMLDCYDPFRKTEEIDQLFSELSSFLPDLIEKILAKQNQTEYQAIPKIIYPINVQKKIGLELMKSIGFDFNCGRIDESTHPFCGGIPGDIRLTTRYREDEFITSLMGIMHETGHAMYEANLPEPYRDQPVGGALGMSIHESQSLFLEMQCMRSKEFSEHLKILFMKNFALDESIWQNIDIHKNICRVSKGFIRVDSDEATYPCHIMLRYDLEKKLIDGELEAEDLPGAWNDGIKKLLGITPKNDAEGCLQDIHWYGGDFGYFPTYTLGALSAAQFFKTLEKQVPDVKNDLQKADFSRIMDWLKTNIHSKGSLRKPQELMVEVTEEPLKTSYFKEHLEKRYLS